MSEQNLSRVGPVERANDFLNQMGMTRYDDWVHEDLKALLAAYRAFRLNPDAQALASLSGVFQALQDLGGTFGYPLISEIGHESVRFLERGVPRNAKESEMVHILVEALELIVTQKLAGDGGAVGQALVRSIHAALEKLENTG